MLTIFSYPHHSLLIVTLIVTGLSRDTAADVTYDLKVTPQSLAVGQSLTVSVGLVNPSAPVGDIFIYIQKPGQSAHIVFSNRQGSCILPGGYTGTIDVCDFTKNRYTITFPSVTSNHNGLWSVRALLQKPSDSPQIQVVVIVPVTSVTVSPTSLVVVAKQQVTLTCNVNSDVTLPVTYTWKRTQGSSRLDPPSNAVSTTQGNGISNTLQWTAANQDGGSYDCTASNDISLKSITSSIVNVTVYYPADSVTLTTSATTAAVGTAVNVACASGGGNPRPGLVLYREPGHQQVLAVDPPGPLNYVITLQKPDNGAKFNCETEAKLTGLVIPAQVSSTITMNVQFAPTNIQVQQTVLVDEYQIKPVMCETTTSSNPATQLAWSGPSLGTTMQGSQNVDYGVKSYNGVTITGDRKLNSATYTCTATYMNNVIFTKTATMSVYFSPSSIVFYDTSTNAMIESQPRDLHCRTDTSNPAGNVTWYRLLAGTTSPIPALVPNSTPGDNGGVVVTSDVRITPSRQENLAQYWCKVEFTYSNSTTVTREAAHITLAVNYPVDAVITISPGNDIVEGGHVTLTCETSGGNPTNPLTYTWTYNNNVLNQFTGRTLDYPSISYNQGGQYRCTVVSAGGSTNADKTIDVKYKPRFDEYQPQQSSQGGALKGSVTFTLIILANPAPSSATWSKSGVNLGARFTSSNVGLTYNLRVDNIQEQDYGIYTCRLVNSVGATEINITLNPTGRPFTPSNLIVVTRTSTSITLIWTSEFSGATDQLFSLQYALIDGSWSPEVYNITDLGKGRTVIQEVTGLQPETPYKFRVGSKNNLGLISNYSPEVTSLTKVTFMLSGFTIMRDGDQVTITWSVNDKYKSDYNTAVVVVSYTVERKPTIDGPDPGTKSVSGPFTDGRVVFDVLKWYTYVYDVTVRDGTPTLYQRLGLRISDGPVGTPISPAEGDHVTLTCNVDIRGQTYKPRIDESQQHRREIGAALTESATFILSILSNPSPMTALWTKQNASLGARFTSSNEGLTYKLRVNQVQVEDYGNYTCRLVNTIGESEFTFTLNPRTSSFFLAGPPTTPTNFAAISSTDVSLTLSWRSEFSGASSQNFSLQYSLLDGKWSPKLFDIIDPGNGKTVCRKITNLRPKTVYQLRVRSRNILGLYSNYTPTVLSSTIDSVNAPDTGCLNKVLPAITLCDPTNGDPTDTSLLYKWTYEECTLNHETGKTLVLDKIGPDQSGFYSCTLPGVGTDIMNVHVSEAPPLVAIAIGLAVVLLVILVATVVFVVKFRRRLRKN